VSVFQDRAPTPPNGRPFVVVDAVPERDETKQSPTVTVSFRNGTSDDPEPEPVPNRETDETMFWTWQKGGWPARLVCVCLACGKPFGARGPSKWCSPRCSRFEACNRRQQRRQGMRIVCDCGKPIECPPTGRTPRHCSPACRQRAYRQRRNAAVVTPVEASP